MSAHAARQHLSYAVIGAALLVLGIVMLTGGLVVANAWSIGQTMFQSTNPPTAPPPMAQRRWYTRSLLLTRDGVASPVPVYPGVVEGRP